jgi:hypothetical protein
MAERAVKTASQVSQSPCTWFSWVTKQHRYHGPEGVLQNSYWEDVWKLTPLRLILSLTDTIVQVFGSRNTKHNIRSNMTNITEPDHYHHGQVSIKKPT